MMFRLSCFNTHIQSHKQKKTVHLSAEAIQKNLEDCSQNKALQKFTSLTAEGSSKLKVQIDTFSSSVDCPKDTSAVDADSKSEEIDRVCDISVLKAAGIKKSKSLGSGLDMKGRDSGCSGSEDEIDQQFSCDGSHDNCGSLVPSRAEDPQTSPPNQFHETLPSDSLHVTCDNQGSIFSIGDAPNMEKEPHDNSDAQLSGEHTPDREKESHENSDAQLSDGHTLRTPPVFVRSISLPNISSSGWPTVSHLRQSRSAEDLNVLDARRRDILMHEVGTELLQYQARSDLVSTIHGKNGCGNPVDDNFVTYNCVGSAKDWIIPMGDEVNMDSHLLRNSSSHQGEELPSRDFKIKRIEEWVIDLQHCSPLEESNELPASEDHVVSTGKSSLNVPATSIEGKVNPGMEAVKKYISSLSPTATAAQLVNHCLVVIPFLSAFSSLKALNLSGNAIVRITAGSLPRGLHILNLSKNNISTIEGLRDLTRLRVLDLSYNRILRIGHGLASCSSLKELYLAGNKISEVEGLHRLLKLNVLDLRFNKISTTKCLGQLAANYNSLQAISLEGNPAQKNVGDEQVKKYLQGLLPHLTYFNRQPIKVGTGKDTADRSARLGISAHQIDRGLKTDLKAMRKGTHATANKVASSSIHGRRGQAAALSKPSKSRHARLPPSGTKPVTQQNQVYDFSNKLLSFRPELSMRRSRSEGTIGAL